MKFVETINTFLDLLDAHEGAVAMLGIAITVFVFRSELANNFFTLEQENFNKIFGEVIQKDIPNCLTELRKATASEWDKKYQDLTDTLDKMLTNCQYYMYAMPFFYFYLKEKKQKIGDLVRHDNWSLYRTSAQQTGLVEKECCKIIKAVNNVSKGRVFEVRISQFRPICSMKKWFERKFVDRPIDRIVENIVPASIESNFSVTKIDGANISEEDYCRLCVDTVNIVCLSPNYNIDRIIPVKPSGKFYFGYVFNLRFGKRLGVIQLKGERDRTVSVNRTNIKLFDCKLHKVVVLWKKENTFKKYFTVFKLRVDGEE